MEIIRVENVSKVIAGKTILHDISFSVKAGSVIGLLGPNGAGKTIMLRLLNGVIDAVRLKFPNKFKFFHFNTNKHSPIF
ncbi:ATP-binding cassette domain-containing protein [Neobacillus notoginsengisoli]|uniref:ATP-binding cassette domain-containing protein n=1 Tax=Neobacillus notoginsengisoli TaxID=1578198 RepID=A0A417YXT2_9BACI|nr:ATP-binding cassette domain-containing protein [Neobacillus notoginsengisoli]RHW42559.1 ATP-binding cassette domain-containing protein [Neobacillus notoginsengisoli]